MEVLKEGRETNTTDGAYKGEKVGMEHLPANKAASLKLNEQENTDADNAYFVKNGNVVQGILTQSGELRWYGFILSQSSKVSIMLHTAKGVDSGICLFKWEQKEERLSWIGGSTEYGAGREECCNVLLDSGVYYFAISAYEGSGEYTLAFYVVQDSGNGINVSIAEISAADLNPLIIADNPYGGGMGVSYCCYPHDYGDYGNYSEAFLI